MPPSAWPYHRTVQIRVDHVKLPVADLQRTMAYYAAFVLDPDGHNIEAVYHGGRDE
jgi:predicted lactoylglutathione lyase